MYKALYLSPMIPSSNINETTHFFEKNLLFTKVRDDGSYVILDKNGFTLHILNAGHEIGQMEFYLEVDDVDQVWDRLKESIKGLKVKAPFNRTYGMREIHVEVPATRTLLFIGQQIEL